MNNQDDEIRANKLDLLHRLMELKQYGYELNGEYSLDSSVEDMEKEVARLNKKRWRDIYSKELGIINMQIKSYTSTREFHEEMIHIDDKEEKMDLLKRIDAVRDAGVYVPNVYSIYDSVEDLRSCVDYLENGNEKKISDNLKDREMYRADSDLMIEKILLTGGNRREVKMIGATIDLSLERLKLIVSTLVTPETKLNMLNMIEKLRSEIVTNIDISKE